MITLRHLLDSYTSNLEKLMSFEDLPRGWHFGRGSAIQHSVIRDAAAVLQAGRSAGFSMSDSFPGPDGGVLVTFYEGQDHYVQVSIEGIGAFEVFYEVNDTDQLRHDCASVAEVGLLLSKIYGDIWRTTYALPSTLHNISTTTAIDSWTTHLNHLQTEVGSHVLMRIAQSQQAALSAITWEHSTQQSPGLLAHTGDSTPARFPLAQAS